MDALLRLVGMFENGEIDRLELEKRLKILNIDIEVFWFFLDPDIFRSRRARLLLAEKQKPPLHAQLRDRELLPNQTSDFFAQMELNNYLTGAPDQ